MAKTTYISIPAGLEDKYWSGLQEGDRFTNPRIRIKTALLSRAKLENIAARTYLQTIKNLWAGFSDAEKTAWKTTDFHAQKHGWRNFVADQSQRIKLGLPGTATPNTNHQDLVGKIHIEAPANEIKLAQPHPYAYWIYQKVTGYKSKYSPILVTEKFYLPLEIGISYKANLVSTGEGSFAKFYATILHLYQGQNLLTNHEINLDLSTDWKRTTATVSSLIGQAIAYNLYFHFYNVTGDLYFDNILSNHSAQNWARDIYCKKIEQDFTRAYYQVPKHWAPITMPDGAGYWSEYPN